MSIYPDYSSYLKTDGIDFPTSISQIPEVEKLNDLAINVYGDTVSKKLEKVNIFPYHISEQPKDKQRINLLLISEDEVVVNEDEGVTDENYDLDAVKNPTEIKRNKILLLLAKILINYCMIKTANVGENTLL